MHKADGDPMAVAVAGDIQGAAAVVDYDSVGAGGEDTGGFVGDQGLADFGHFDGEGAAESAALVHFVQWEVFDAFDGADEVDGDLGGQVDAAAVAGIVVGDFARGTGLAGPQVGAEDFRDEFGELEGFGDQVLDTGQVGVILEKERVIIADHGGAGGGGGNYAGAVGEGVEEMAGQDAGLIVIAVVELRLAAAGLVGGQVHFTAEESQQADRGQGGMGEKAVG